jgi:AraC-like DNA-binding protein
MPRRQPELDRQWDELMALCEKEKEFKTGNRHPKLLKFVSPQIDELAKQLGFSSRQILRREFRAERVGGHISRIITEL